MPTLSGTTVQHLLKTNNISSFFFTRDNFSGIPYPCRGLFIIDPEKVLKMMTFHPCSLGRSTKEVLRCIDSLQLTREYNNKVCTPADWDGQKSTSMIDTSTTPEDINDMFKRGVVTHFMPSGREYMRTVGSLQPTYEKLKDLYEKQSDDAHI